MYSDLKNLLDQIEKSYVQDHKLVAMHLPPQEKKAEAALEPATKKKIVTPKVILKHPRVQATPLLRGKRKIDAQEEMTAKPIPTQDRRIFPLPALPKSARGKLPVPTNATRKMEEGKASPSFMERVQEALLRKTHPPAVSATRIPGDTLVPPRKISQMAAGRSRDPGIELALMLITGGLYWGIWMRRILFELTMALKVDIGLEVFSVAKIFFHAPRYVRALWRLADMAEQKAGQNLSCSSFLRIAILCPPVFVACMQSFVNDFYLQTE